MKFVLLYLSYFLFLFTGCNKKELDLSSQTYFGIQTVLKSANCAASCGEIADCEGKTIRIKGKLDEININAAQDQFYLIDEKENKYQVEVKVDKTASDDIFQKLNDKGGEVFLVEGRIEGYDARTNYNCKRQFTLYVDDVSKVNQIP